MKIGVTAGASTPEWIIMRVIKKLMEISLSTKDVLGNNCFDSGNIFTYFPEYVETHSGRFINL